VRSTAERRRDTWRGASGLNRSQTTTFNWFLVVLLPTSPLLVASRNKVYEHSYTSPVFFTTSHKTTNLQFDLSPQSSMAHHIYAPHWYAYRPIPSEQTGGKTDVPGTACRRRCICWWRQGQWPRQWQSARRMLPAARRLARTDGKCWVVCSHGTDPCSRRTSAGSRVETRSPRAGCRSLTTPERDTIH